MQHNFFLTWEQADLAVHAQSAVCLVFGYLHGGWEELGLPTGLQLQSVASSNTTQLNLMEELLKLICSE